MPTEIYIEALLVDEKLADKVWEAWDKGEIDDLMAWAAQTFHSCLCLTFVMASSCLECYAVYIYDKG